MTDTQFIEAIQSLKGLPEDMVAHVVSMAVDLTPEQREQAVKELKEGNSRVEASMQEMEKIYQEGEEHMKEVEKEILPLRKLTEQTEKSADVSSAASQLDQAA